MCRGSASLIDPYFPLSDLMTASPLAVYVNKASSSSSAYSTARSGVTLGPLPTPPRRPAARPTARSPPREARRGVGGERARRNGTRSYGNAVPPVSSPGDHRVAATATATNDAVKLLEIDGRWISIFLGARNSVYGT